MNGKGVIDAANNIGAPVANSVAIIQSAANQASVYHAFNIYGWQNFAEPEVGGPEKAELVDQLLRLWFTLAFEQKKGRRMALKLLVA